MHDSHSAETALPRLLWGEGSSSRNRAGRGTIGRVQTGQPQAQGRPQCVHQLSRMTSDPPDLGMSRSILGAGQRLFPEPRPPALHAVCSESLRATLALRAPVTDPRTPLQKVKSRKSPRHWQQEEESIAEQYTELSALPNFGARKGLAYSPIHSFPLSHIHYQAGRPDV